jgi:hypothetical protein
VDSDAHAVPSELNLLIHENNLRRRETIDAMPRQLGLGHLEKNPLDNENENGHEDGDDSKRPLEACPGSDPSIDATDDSVYFSGGSSGGADLASAATETAQSASLRQSQSQSRSRATPTHKRVTSEAEAAALEMCGIQVDRAALVLETRTEGVTNSAIKRAKSTCRNADVAISNAKRALLI